MQEICFPSQLSFNEITFAVEMPRIVDQQVIDLNYECSSYNDGRVLDILTGETGETRDCSEKLVRLRSTAKNVKFSWYCRVQQTDFLRFRLQEKIMIII